jgi:hypothetical protein
MKGEQQMTTNEKLEILRTAEDNAFLALREILNPDAIADTLYKIIRVRDIAERIRYDGDSVYDAEIEELAGEDTPTPVLTVVPETATEEPAEPEPTETSVPVEETVTTSPGTVLDKTEVRRQLASISRDKDMDIAPLMAQMGYTRFKDIPAERYAELLKLAKEA